MKLRTRTLALKPSAEEYLTIIKVLLFWKLQSLRSLCLLNSAAIQKGPRMQCSLFCPLLAGWGATRLKSGCWVMWCLGSAPDWWPSCKVGRRAGSIVFVASIIISVFNLWRLVVLSLRTGVLSAGLAASELRPLHSFLSHVNILLPRYFQTHICRYVLQGWVRVKYLIFFFLLT